MEYPKKAKADRRPPSPFKPATATVAVLRAVPVGR